jgi:ABC-type phosphate transport system substrate-binding protein
VAAVVKGLPGSIGYFELSYAESSLLACAAIENQKGRICTTVPGERGNGRIHEGKLSASNFSIVNEPGPVSTLFRATAAF